MMLKRFLVLFIFLGLVGMANLTFAMPDLNPYQVNPSGRVVNVPNAAAQAAEEVFVPLGSAFDPGTGQIVEGIAIIHYKKGYHHQSGHTGGGGTNDATLASSCFAFLASGARWKMTESYIVDPTNAAGLDGAVVHSALAASLEAWDSEAPFDIFGNEKSGIVDAANIGNLNGENEVLFANISSQGAIAVTYVWGIFGGRPAQRKIVEWNMVFDDTDFDWSFTGFDAHGNLVMDFQNIATHEVGHAAGMGHPADSCTEETMYRFGANGETKKRSLELGDITGIKKLYK